ERLALGVRHRRELLAAHRDEAARRRREAAAAHERGEQRSGEPLAARGRGLRGGKVEAEESERTGDDRVGRGGREVSGRTAGERRCAAAARGEQRAAPGEAREQGCRRGRGREENVEGSVVG